jgi:hypothetical protein
VIATLLWRLAVQRTRLRGEGRGDGARHVPSADGVVVLDAPPAPVRPLVQEFLIGRFRDELVRRVVSDVLERSFIDDAVLHGIRQLPEDDHLDHIFDGEVVQDDAEEQPGALLPVLHEIDIIDVVDRPQRVNQIVSFHGQLLSCLVFFLSTTDIHIIA